MVLFSLRSPTNGAGGATYPLHDIANPIAEPCVSDTKKVRTFRTVRTLTEPNPYHSPTLLTTL